MRVIIIDDELHARKNLSRYLNEIDDIEILTEASNIIEAYDAILTFKPDLIFLDISMPGGSGFDLLEKFKNIKFEIIFVTAHNEFAIQSLNDQKLGLRIHYVLSQK